MESKIQYRNQLKRTLQPLLENFSGGVLHPITESKLQDKFGNEFSLTLRKILVPSLRKTLKEANEA